MLRTTPRAGIIASFVAVIFALLAMPLLLAGAASAAEIETCDDIVTGDGWQAKVEGEKNDGDPGLTVTAPDGFLIDSYCVKTGSTQQGNGPVLVEVDPPATTVTVDHPAKDGVSHFIIHLIPAPELCPEGSDKAGQVIPEGESTEAACDEPDEPVKPNEPNEPNQPEQPINPPNPPNPSSPPAPTSPAAPTLPETGLSDHLGAMAALSGLLLVAGSALIVRWRRMDITEV